MALEVKMFLIVVRNSVVTAFEDYLRKEFPGANITIHSEDEVILSDHGPRSVGSGKKAESRIPENCSGFIVSMPKPIKYVDMSTFMTVHNVPGKGLVYLVGLR